MANTKSKCTENTFHDLRHAHASLMIRNGAHLKVVMARLGRKDVETTLRYYAHLWPNADQEALQKLGNEMERYKKNMNDPGQM
ncbi:tyrosine-type recombinase/integrase [Peribacillus saganii]|uniref:tyrosine-type recombinase/integrase n=1 Tax=Peribacillus saganii TaxID=2303992 RepID=UPI001313DF37|nr:tyrosine-type recombinase/integrase [Peribacillus saganii]